MVRSFESVAATQPAAPAVVWRRTVWTYEHIAASSAAAAHLLHARSLERGARIALLFRNSPQYVALYYGVLGAGYAAVPLNAQERAPVLARQIEHSGASVLIADPQHPEWPSLRTAVENSNLEVLELPLEDSGDSLHARLRSMAGSGPDESAGVSGRSADDLAVIIYTSGTTGRPKGVMLSHGNLQSNALAIIDYLKLTKSDCTLSVLPFQFSYGQSVLNSHLLAGASLAIEENFAFPHVTLQRMQDERITGFAGVPSTFALLLSRCRLQDFDLTSLRYITQAGGPMPRPLIERLRKEAPATQIFVMYGQTEATARLTYLPPEEIDTRPGSVGVPITGVEIEVRDAAGSVPAGTVGEIHARGPNVMLGYWNDLEATRQALTDDGWLRTGDLGHFDSDGYLYIDGRTVEMIKVGAFRVSPHEVEEVIAGIEGVEEVAVTGIPDDLLGQAVKAVVIRRAGARLAELAVKEHCRRHLASYKLPKIIEFAAALPRTASGKVQRFNLA